MRHDLRFNIRAVPGWSGEDADCLLMQIGMQTYFIVGSHDERILAACMLDDRLRVVNFAQVNLAYSD